MIGWSTEEEVRSVCRLVRVPGGSDSVLIAVLCGPVESCSLPGVLTVREDGRKRLRQCGAAGLGADTLPPTLQRARSTPAGLARMQRNQRSSDGWSTALRDDDEDSESDEKAAANDSEPPAPTARSHKAPVTSAAYAQRTEAVREGSDWDWNWAGDAVDIGAVVEPASLKFTETPFTLASRNARPEQAPQKSGTKAKRAAARPGRPDTARGTASAKSDRAAPTTTAVPNRSAVPASASTATKYLNSTRPRPSDAKAPTDQTAPSAAARPLTGRTSNQSARPLGDYSNNATERTLHAPDPKLHSLARRTSGFRPAPKLADDPPPLGPTPVGSETPALTPKYPHGVQAREVLKPACAPPSPNRSSSPLINSTPHARAQPRWRHRLIACTVWT